MAKALSGETVATTNLFFLRLCKSASRTQSSGGGPLGQMLRPQREAFVAALVRLPDEVIIVPMRALAWRMGTLMREHSGLSTLGAEAIATAEALAASLLVSDRDDSPGIRGCAKRLGIGYSTVAR